MLVVKRPFKSFGKHYTVGTVITDPTAIKLFKSKVAEGKIIVVTEQNYSAMSAYFEGKHNVKLPALTGDKPLEGTKEVTTEKPTVKVAVAKAVTKSAKA